MKEDTPDKELMLADAEALLRTLNETLGMSAFVAYGTLLGAVRAGKVIGHDNAVDLAYYRRFELPADVMPESLVLQRRLCRAGWSSQRRTGGFLQVWKSDGGSFDWHLDLFVAYHCDGWFSLHKWVRDRLHREAVLPLGDVTLEGQRLPAPGDPEAVLAVIYGEGWRVPDPSFAYDYASPIRNRAEAWVAAGGCSWSSTRRGPRTVRRGARRLRSRGGWSLSRWPPTSSGSGVASSRRSDPRTAGKMCAG